MMVEIKNQIAKLLQQAGVTGEIELVVPPNPEMGDLSFACFAFAKESGGNPKEVADQLKSQLSTLNSQIVESVESVGPYVNLVLNASEVAKMVDGAVGDGYGSHESGKGKKIMVEFAHPNTHKMFHIGHLRNITTGESIVRMLENAGHKVIRANYQGDVGMHIAKSLWGIDQLRDEYEAAKKGDLHDRVAFLGKAYALGGTSYEEDEEIKSTIQEINRKIYANDASIKEVYETTRGWSLDYFEHIYKRVGSHFDRLYFESEVYESGEKIVREFLKKGVFEESQGAIIFPGSKHDLHDRVFITSQGFPGYEAKEMGLGQLQFAEHSPDEVIHVVAREQSGYFEVTIKALEHTLPESKGKERHLIYGWVHLKEGKMSSRTGNVVLGEWLIDEVKDRIEKIMEESGVADKETVAERVAVGAVKYSFLKTGVSNDIAFDMEESVSTSGHSGPYLLYIVARVKSILRKAGKVGKVSSLNFQVSKEAKELLMKIAAYPEVTKSAVESYDPSKIAHYLFDLAQSFNHFYHACPVLQAEDEDVKAFRLRLIEMAAVVMEHGLHLLGIETVEEM